MYHLHIGGQVIGTSGEHPFYVAGKGWTAANELQVGDGVLCADGSTVRVEEVFDTGEWEVVYNLRVADHHTYFVGEEAWGWCAWAHNAYLYRAITDQDYAEYASSFFTHIKPRAPGGTILQQIEGNGVKTKYISASQSYAGTARFQNSSQGVIKIDKDKLIELGSGVVDHANLLAAAANSIDPVRTRKNVESADEVLITNGIPKSAIVRYVPPTELGNYPR